MSSSKPMVGALILCHY